jgi:hypothetical protein
MQYFSLPVIVEKAPIGLFRKYFGEMLSMYFSFLGFYIRWLMIASVLGVLTFIASYFDPINLANSVYPTVLLIEITSYRYSIFLAIWATVILQFWKRKNAANVYKWNMHDYTDKVLHS